MTYLRNWIVVIGAFAAACTNSTTPDPVGGETHFLHACDDTASCGVGLDCVCGVCTKPCASDNTCKDKHGSATCESAGTPNGACVNPQASPVCDVDCTLDLDCSTLGTGYTCESGSCRKLSAGACVQEGVIYANDSSFMIDCNACTCSDGEVGCTRIACVDGGMDSTMPGEPFPQDLACLRDDTDGGVAFPSRLMVRAAPALCATGQAVIQRPGVELVGNDRELPFFELTATDAYWYSWNDLSIVRAELGTGRTWSFAENRLDVTALAIDGCQIVAGGRDHSDVLSVGIDGSDPRNLGLGAPTGTSGPVTLLLDETHAFVSQSDSLQRVPRAGGTIETLGTRAQGVHGPDMVMLGDDILWIAFPGNNFLLPHVRSIPKDGSPGAVFGPTLPSNPSALARDATHVYVALQGTNDNLGNHNNDGAIVRIPIAGDQVETVTTVGRPVLSVAVDATRIYWLRLDANNGEPFRASVWSANKTTPQDATQIADDAWTFRIDDTHVYWNQSCTTGNTQDVFLVRIAKSALD